jgi:RNA polymerase sigma-70 factor (ECF subfamily)
MPKAVLGQEKSDKELVELSLKDKDAFLYIVRRYKDKLYGYIRRITDVSHEDAEDILQEIFIKVYSSLNDFDSDLKFSSWIFRIAHNQVISAYRKRKARPQHKALPLSDEQIVGVLSDFDIESRIDAGLLRQKISVAIAKLEKKYREVIILKFFAGNSYQEMSDILRKPPGTVASLLNKAKSEFKKRFKQ